MPDRLKVYRTKELCEVLNRSLDSLALGAGGTLSPCLPPGSRRRRLAGACDQRMARWARKVMSQDFDRIAATLDPPILARVLGIEKIGAAYRCPFRDLHTHGDRSPSLSIFHSGGRTVAKCHGCGFSGSPVQLAAKVLGVSTPEAAAELVRRTGVSTVSMSPLIGPTTLVGKKTDEKKKEPIPDVKSFHKALNVEARAYLREHRGLFDSVIDRYELGTDGQRLTIPIQDDSGEVRNVRKWLSPEKRNSLRRKMKNLNGRGSPPRLFPIDQLKHDELLLLEGELDALAAISSGFRAITATCGADAWRDSLSRPFAAKKVILLMDHDDSGRRGAEKRGSSLVRAGARVIIAKWPEDRPAGWDVTDELKKYGRDSLADIIGAAKPYQTPGRVGLADVEPETIEFLWRPYVPLGKLCILEGDPGQGKSWLTLALAACVSNKGQFPGATRASAPGNVLLLSGEDGPADTIRPRLDLLGADVSRVHAVTACLALDEAGALQLRAHTAETQPALVVLDPIQLYFGAQVDLHRSNETRPALARLTALAEEFCCAVVAVPSSYERHSRQGAVSRTWLNRHHSSSTLRPARGSHKGRPTRPRSLETQSHRGRP